MNEEKETKFLNLVERVQACTRCPRMKDSARVLGPGCGPVDAKIVFIGEAPGRLGADGSHLPFHGDKSGHNFETLIEQVGLSRYKVFVTNAVLCNPKDASGNNATPTQSEIANCAPFLKEQLEILDAEVVVTLGGVSLRSCSLIEQHALTLKENVRTSNKWFGRLMLPAYHPGQRAMIHRSFANQLSDYQFIAETVQRLEHPKGRRASSVRQGSEKLGQVAKALLEQQPQGLSYFALHKLCFLAEVAQLEATSERITNSYVVRQKDGPYFVDLHLAKLPTLIAGLLVERMGASIRLRLSAQRSIEDSAHQSHLSLAEIETINRTCQRYGTLSDSELKRVAYLSSPMRAILRKERKLHINLFNAAVLPYVEKDG